MEISSGDLLDVVARSAVSDAAGDACRALKALGKTSFEVARIDQANITSIYEVRLAASRAGRGPKTEGFEEFVEYLRSSTDEWIYWVTFTDGEGTTWYITLNAAATIASVTFKVFNVPQDET